MKIYIAGKVTGDPNYKTKFYQAAKQVEELGHTVLLPSMLPSTGLTEADYMRICLAMIDTADLVLFLPDYIESQGAMVEWMLCKKNGKPTDTLAHWMDEPGGAAMKWGIWNSNTKRFCFGIQASSRAEAEMQFYQRAPGKAGYLWRYEAKRIPEGWKNPPNPNWPKQRRDTA